MAKLLSQEEFNLRVQDINPNYSVISIYAGKRKPVTIKCNKHDQNFSVLAECFMRGKNDVRGKCPQCEFEEKTKNRIDLICAYCGKQFTRPKSKLNASKSGLYFCCREHKDLAQRLENGFSIIWPSHYNISGSVYSYRNYAFRNYAHECAICKWSEDEDILEVHHIDENRENNDLNNLIILCPLCHRKLTSHKYILKNRIEIIKL